MYLPTITTSQLAAALQRLGYTCTLHSQYLRLERESDGRVLLLDDEGIVPQEKVVVLLAAAAVSCGELLAALGLVKRRSGTFSVVRPASADDEREVG